MTGMTVLAARPATKYASRAAQNMELSKHARINLNELVIEQEMEKQSSQLQQEGQYEEKQEISSSEQDDQDYKERGHRH